MKLTKQKRIKRPAQSADKVAALSVVKPDSAAPIVMPDDKSLVSSQVQNNAEALTQFLQFARGLVNLDRLEATQLTHAEDAQLALLISETEVKLRQNVSRVTPKISLEHKFGKIILDALNRDISIKHAVSALVRFFRNDFKASRRESRLRRLGILSAETPPAKTLQILRDNDLNVVKEAIARIKLLRKVDPLQAGEYASLIQNEKLSNNEKIFVAFALYDAGNVSGSEALLSSLGNVGLNANQTVRRNRVFSENQVLKESVDALIIPIIESLREEISELRPKVSDDTFNTAYVAASSLPMNTAGYTTRTHYIVSALDNIAKKSGGALFPVTRPGFPFDRFDLEQVTLSDDLISEVDDIKYYHLRNETTMQDSIIEFARNGSLSLATFFIENNIKSVTAASNHINAMPAFIAARAIGIPFTYEVRGLWEETTAAKRKGWEMTERYKVERLLETYLIANANNTFFITRQVKELFFPRKGKHVKPGILSEFAGGEAASGLAPNCAVIDPSKKAGLPKYGTKKKDVLTLAYIGSLVKYEGLQLMLRAFSLDAELRRSFKLNIVGGGVYAQELRSMVQRLNLDDMVHFTGRVPPSDVGRWFNSADVVVVPRLPHRVCQLVPPLKPLEAMSSNRVCLASNVAPIADLIKDSETGYLFTAGDVKSLTKTLKRLHGSQDQFKKIGKNAYNFVRDNRDWKTVAANIHKASTSS